MLCAKVAFPQFLKIRSIQELIQLQKKTKIYEKQFLLNLKRKIYHCHFTLLVTNLIKQKLVKIIKFKTYFHHFNEEIISALPFSAYRISQIQRVKLINLKRQNYTNNFTTQMLTPFLIDQIFQTSFSFQQMKWESNSMQNQNLLNCQLKSQISNAVQPPNLKRRNYKKNIIGHIIKKSIREFLNPLYFDFINQICKNSNEKIDHCYSYYSKQIEKITGPSHLQILIVPMDRQEIQLKKVFVTFLEWYLKERYLRYLLLDGRMQNKQKYIDYKNKKLNELIKKLKIKAIKAQQQFIRVLQPSEFLI